MRRIRRSASHASNSFHVAVGWQAVYMDSGMQMIGTASLGAKGKPCCLTRQVLSISKVTLTVSIRHFQACRTNNALISDWTCILKLCSKITPITSHPNPTRELQKLSQILHFVMRCPVHNRPKVSTGVDGARDRMHLSISFRPGESSHIG